MRVCIYTLTHLGRRLHGAPTRVTSYIHIHIIYAPRAKAPRCSHTSDLLYTHNICTSYIHIIYAPRAKAPRCSQGRAID